MLHRPELGNCRFGQHCIVALAYLLAGLVDIEGVQPVYEVVIGGEFRGFESLAHCIEGAVFLISDDCILGSYALLELVLVILAAMRTSEHERCGLGNLLHLRNYLNDVLLAVRYAVGGHADSNIYLLCSRDSDSPCHFGLGACGQGHFLVLGAEIELAAGVGIFEDYAGRALKLAAAHIGNHALEGYLVAFGGEERQLRHNHQFFLDYEPGLGVAAEQFLVVGADKHPVGAECLAGGVFNLGAAVGAYHEVRIEGYGLAEVAARVGFLRVSAGFFICGIGGSLLHLGVRFNRHVGLAHHHHILHHRAVHSGSPHRPHHRLHQRFAVIHPVIGYVGPDRGAVGRICTERREGEGIGAVAVGGDVEDRYCQLAGSTLHDEALFSLGSGLVAERLYRKVELDRALRAAELAGDAVSLISPESKQAKLYAVVVSIEIWQADVPCLIAQMQGQTVEFFVTVEQLELYIEVVFRRGDYEFDAALLGERIEEQKAGNRRLAVGRREQSHLPAAGDGAAAPYHFIFQLVAA